MSQNQKNEFKVLWIDDQLDLYGEFVDGLERRGLRVTAVTSVDAAFDVLEKETFDLVLLDLRMPKKTGFDFLRQRLANSKVPICVLSSYLHLIEYQKQINRFRSNVAVMDKDLPNPKTDAFTVFANKLKRMIEKPPELAPKAFERSVIKSIE